jgi:hypothetical protein
MKLSTTSFLACLALAPTAAFGSITLAGFHQFNNSEGSATTKIGADAGTLGAANITFGARVGQTTRISSANGTESSGGSTDGYYGPDAANGGIPTGQAPIFSESYQPEVPGPTDPRLSPSYAFGAPNPSAPGTVMDGFAANLNGVDFYAANSSGITYNLDRFMFDAFLGDPSQFSATAVFEAFTVRVLRANGTSSSFSRNVSQGFAGVHSTGGELLDQPLNLAGGKFPVNNQLDYGFGTNYLDYGFSLAGISLNPGDVLQVRFNVTGVGAVVRGDNFLVTALEPVVPETSNIVALGALFGLGLMSRRRTSNR